MASVIESNPRQNYYQKSAERRKKNSPKKLNNNLARSAIGLPKLPKIDSRNPDEMYNNKFVLDFTNIDDKRCSS